MMHLFRTLVLNISFLLSLTVSFTSKVFCTSQTTSRTSTTATPTHPSNTGITTPGEVQANSNVLNITFSSPNSSHFLFGNLKPRSQGYLIVQSTDLKPSFLLPLSPVCLFVCFCSG
ncbi:hypothetical protein EI94DRAFT_1829476 [Lactarius quietus]|nr:hypothetical protein EI94DRAFT_1829476 [Lactarius quietus]